VLVKTGLKKLADENTITAKTLGPQTLEKSPKSKIPHPQLEDEEVELEEDEDENEEDGEEEEYMFDGADLTPGIIGRMSEIVQAWYWARSGAS
jgi:hypothetical protein